MHVFQHRTFLEEDLAVGVEDEDVHGAMAQAGFVHDAAAFAADHFVALIDDIKNVLAFHGI